MGCSPEKASRATDAGAKKHFKLFAMVVILATLMLTLCACGKSLSGEYRLIDDSQGSTHYQSITFTSDGKMAASDQYGFTASGSYEIDGNQVTFIMSFLGVSHSENHSFSTSGNTLILDGSKYEK